jgi:hypothetical protein
MTPSQAISMLDRQLAAHGQAVKVGAVPMSGFVRGYRPQELIGEIKQSDRLVIVSPTSFGIDAPPSTGFIVVDGQPRRIQATGMIKLNDVLVRIEYQVTGF